jgi:IS1 family transposase/transposase-like protein
MVVSTCSHESFKKNGTTKSGDARYRCNLCGKSWTAFTSAFDGMRVGMDLAVQIIGLLCEGNSVAATARLTNTDKYTVINLSVLVGQKCEQYMANRLQKLPVDDVQCDEIWQYVFCKHATARLKKYVGGVGDSYCYTAVERNTKLLLTWHMGRRNEPDTHAFCHKLDRATTGRFQISTDGWAPYQFAVLRQLGNRVDHGVVIKTYAEPEREDRRKYSPSRIIGAVKKVYIGKPDMDRVCTSHCERLNGSIRTFCKRMGRLTYCFSKKWTNHQAALGLLFAHYNFCRKHRSLGRITPAMAHGLTEHCWTVRELLQNVMGISPN